MQLPTWRKLAVFFGAPIRFPGLGTLVLGAYAFIPDTEARLQFWGNTVGPVIAPYLASPWTGVVLVAIGIAWLWKFRGVVHVHHGNLNASANTGASVELQVIRGNSSVALGEAQPTAPSAGPTNAERDAWVQDAMIFAVQRKWPGLGDKLNEGETSPASHALQKMRQLAADGKMLIWGRLGPNQLHIEIPQDFWVDHQIDILHALMAEQENVCTERVSNDASHVQYWALMVSKTQVEAIWPDPDLSLQEAALVAYERAEAGGWLGNVVGETTDPNLRLEIFKQMMLFQARNQYIVLHGIKPPSRQSLPIPHEQIAGLHPVERESSIQYLSPNQIAYHTVTIRQSDMEKMIGLYHVLATDPQSGVAVGAQVFP